MSTPLRTEAGFAVYSSILFSFPLGCLVVILLQRASDRYQSKVAAIERDRVTTALLYAVYVSGLLCGLVGFSLHFASSILWCEKFGLLPCFALLGLSKSFLYLFFLRRAKFAQGIIANKCFQWFFTVIAPGYLFVYWMIYCILTTIIFTGNYSGNATISNCSLLGEYAQGFSIFAGFVELLNSVVSVTIFTYPLIRTMYQVKLLGSGSDPQMTSKSDYATKLQFISIMKWNVILTSIATLSSVTNLFMMLVAGHYIWLFCLGDPLVNGVCAFLMIKPNREYVAEKCSCGCGPKSTADGTSQIECDIKPIDPNLSGGSRGTNTGASASDVVDASRTGTNANTVTTTGTTHSVDVVIH